jgi:predicted nicotinamide N-methyase
MTVDHDAFITANTALATVGVIPEIRMWLADEVTPLWQATEASLEQNGLPPPYWAFCWAGGQALTRYVLDNAALVAGKRVLDFAAGCGSAAVAAAMRGAAVVEAAEIDAFACAAIRLNGLANGVDIALCEGDIVGADCRWDVVVAGDVCYERPMTEHIWPWLKQLAAEGATVLMADPGRAYLPKLGLMEVARMVVPTSLDLEDRTSREVAVYKLVG